jgi:hypothetical protein
MSKTPKSHEFKLTDPETGGTYFIYTQKKSTKKNAERHVKQFLLGGGVRPKKGQTSFLRPVSVSGD